MKRTIYACDRCAKLVTVDQLGSLYVCCPRCDEAAPTERYDLCPDCYREVVAWLDEECTKEVRP